MLTEWQGKLRINHDFCEIGTVALGNVHRLEPACLQSCFSVPGSSVAELYKIFFSPPEIEVGETIRTCKSWFPECVLAALLSRGLQ